jgi:two-component sensor histidine kinase
MSQGLLGKGWRWLERRARLLSRDAKSPAGWRERVFNGVFLTLVIFGGISYLPTFLGALQRGMWGTELLYSLVYVFGISVLMLRRLDFRIRAAIGVLGIYLIGLCTLGIAGLAGSGRIWLFSFTLLTCLFLGLRWGLAALGLNILTMVAFLLEGEAWRPGWDRLYLSVPHQEIWAITSGTFILLNGAAVVSLAFIIKGLQASLESSRLLQAELVEKQARLETANQALSSEIQERRRAQAQLTVALSEREGMLKEMHHRVNSHMQVVSSMLSLSKTRIADLRARELMQESQHRVRAVGLIHESMYRSGRLAEISLAAYIEDLARNLFQVYELESRQVELTIEADETALGLDEAVPFGLVLNELMVNALKHAFTLGMGGRLFVRVRRESDGGVELIVSDNGLGLPLGFVIGEGLGMGLYLAKSLVQNQLHGQFELAGGDGVRVRIKFQPNSSGPEAYPAAGSPQSNSAA